MKITTKLLGSYLLLAIVVLVLGAVSVFGLDSMADNTKELYTDRLQPAIILAEMAQLMENTRVHLITGVVNGDPTRGVPALENVAEVNELLERYQSTNLHPEEREILDELTRNWIEYSDYIVITEEQLQEENFIDAMNSIRAGGAWYGATNMHLMSLLEKTDELSSQAHRDNGSLFRNLRRIIIFSALWSLVIAIAMGTLMGRRIGRTIKVVSHQLHTISQGNLTGKPIETKRKDELGILIRATNKMQDELKQLIHSVSSATNHVLISSEELKHSTNEVVQGAEQIAITMQELSSGSESQAMFTSDLSEHMNEFVETIEESVNQSEDVSSSATQVRELTGQGQHLMDSSVKQMHMIHSLVRESVGSVRGLDQKAEDVSSLITVIEGVAEQTNLLALNATIEAARAGEHGKGFAVVANEVRKLSEEVAHSVTEITSIVKSMQEETSKVVDDLEHSYDEVNQGSKQIEEMGETFQTISASIETMDSTIHSITEKLANNKVQTIKMSTSIEEIASISEESAAGIEQTSASSQQTTSTMQEVSASSEELANLAEELNRIVERFHI